MFPGAHSKLLLATISNPYTNEFPWNYNNKLCLPGTGLWSTQDSETSWSAVVVGLCLSKDQSSS